VCDVDIHTSVYQTFLENIPSTTNNKGIKYHKIIETAKSHGIVHRSVTLAQPGMTFFLVAAFIAASYLPQLSSATLQDTSTLQAYFTVPKAGEESRNILKIQVTNTRWIDAN